MDALITLSNMFCVQTRDQDAWADDPQGDSFFEKSWPMVSTSSMRRYIAPMTGIISKEMASLALFRHTQKQSVGWVEVHRNPGLSPALLKLSPYSGQYFIIPSKHQSE